MRIDIRTIPESTMRYPSLGDWFYEGAADGEEADGEKADREEVLCIRAVDTLSDNEAFLVALHELVEAWLCRDKGVSQEAVDAFDLAFIPPRNDPDAEPGDHPDAPYRIQHRQAMMVEHLMALFMGVTDYGVVR